MHYAPHILTVHFPAENPPATFLKQILTKCRSKKEKENETRKSALSLSFWSSKTGWKRAAVNTLRCLAGCTLGDFSALWVLQSLYGHWGMGTIMGVSMASGVTTSILLETILLRRGVDKLPWGMAFRTATGMSLVSMLAMETVQNLVDFHLTGGVVLLDDPRFWAAALVSMGAGFLAPMPYNYWRLVSFLLSLMTLPRTVLSWLEADLSLEAHDVCPKEDYTERGGLCPWMLEPWYLLTNGKARRSIFDNFKPDRARDMTSVVHTLVVESITEDCLMPNWILPRS
ncbi:hypothetical protein CFD26_108417 [Aspergillus turcosus]|uniref:DUF4396 domain-containing protein n=1 Tax=Aspergillus turcosus TaxID=1245748 RepID=A0A3R7FC17_9EURO|nr:hypothetical protein CFD26_108417 [Aspergillus turcosus]